MTAADSLRARNPDDILREIIGDLAIKFAVAQAGWEQAQAELAKLKQDVTTTAPAPTPVEPS